MRFISFSKRNFLEMIRDPLTIFFGACFPVVILVLLTVINNNIPAEAASAKLFAIDSLSPGISVFGLSFVSLFAGLLVSKDRCSSFLMRLFSSPLKASDYILGYTLPLIPLSVLQIAVCYGVALLLGMTVSVNILLAVAVLIPSVVLYIAIGLLCGAVFTDKQVGSVCGALLTNISAWLSGTWFPLDLLGTALKKISFCLPFANAVESTRAAMAGNYGDIMKYLWVVIVYAAVLMVVAVLLFSKKMKRDNK